MATFVFENGTQADAAGFTTADTLFLVSSDVANLGGSDSPYTTSSNALGTTTTYESITLSEGGQSLTFGAVALAYASQHNHVVFTNGDVALFGVGTDNAGNLVDDGSLPAPRGGRLSTDGRQ